MVPPLEAAVRLDPLAYAASFRWTGQRLGFAPPTACDPPPGPADL